MLERQSTGKTLDSLQPACGGAMSCDPITLWWTCSCCDEAEAACEPGVGSRGQSAGELKDLNVTCYSVVRRNRNKICRRGETKAGHYLSTL